MKLPTYQRYKSSGVEWLGDVPEHWEHRRFGYLFRFFSGGTPSTDDATLWDGNLPWVSSKDMKSIVISDTEDHISEDAVRKSATCKIPGGSLLIVNRSGILRHSIPTAIIAREMAINQDIRGCVPSGEVDVKFIAYLIAGNQKPLLTLWRQQGATVESLGFESVKTTNIPLPPLCEQRAIAAFLDRETGRVDRLVAKKRELIERLKEKRTALISRTVTRGLPAEAAAKAGLAINPFLKPSGLDWLGDIPKHWEVCKLKRVTISRCDGPFGSGLKSEHYTEEGVRVIRLQNIRFAKFDNSDATFIEPEYYKELGDHSVQPGDLLIAGLGDENHPVGRACVAPSDLGSAIVKADCFRFRLNSKRAVAAYLALQLSATAGALAGALATGTTRGRMNLSATESREVALPPLSEQIAIVAYLDEETVKLDALMRKVETAIERLQEYRTALITAVVTGKIDVRKAQTP